MLDYVNSLTWYTALSNEIVLGKYITVLPASWLSGNTFVSGAGGLRFKSRVRQTGHSVANDSTPLRHFFERSCVARAQ